MNEINDKMNFFIKKIDSLYKINEVYIFGSYAYGTPNHDSDIDICIITEEDNQKIREMLKNIRKLSIDLVNRPLDILIYNKEQFEKRSVNESTIEYIISKKGIKVYG